MYTNRKECGVENAENLKKMEILRGRQKSLSQKIQKDNDESGLQFGLLFVCVYSIYFYVLVLPVILFHICSEVKPFFTFKSKLTRCSVKYRRL